MWGLAHHRGLWGKFRDIGDSTATPFLHPQGPKGLTNLSPCALLVLALPSSVSLSGCNPWPCEQAEFHHLPEMFQAQRTPLPQFREAL